MSMESPSRTTPEPGFDPQAHDWAESLLAHTYLARRSHPNVDEVDRSWDLHSLPTIIGGIVVRRVDCSDDDIGSFREQELARGQTIDSGRDSFIFGPSPKLAALKEVKESAGFHPSTTTYIEGWTGTEFAPQYKPVRAEFLRYYKGRLTQAIGTLCMAGSGIVSLAALSPTPLEWVGTAGLAAIGGGAIMQRGKGKEYVTDVKKSIESTLESFYKGPDSVLIPVHIWLPEIKFDKIGVSDDRSNILDPEVNNELKMEERIRKSQLDYPRNTKGQPYSYFYSINTAGLVLNMIKHDAQPLELWHTFLGEDLRKWRSAIDARYEAKGQVNQALRRQALTGQEQYKGENEELEGVLQEKHAVLGQLIEATVIRYNARRKEQIRTEKLDEIMLAYRDTIEKAITTPEAELEHKNAETLRVFRDLLYEAALPIDPRDEYKVQNLRNMCGYVIEVTKLMTDPGQAEQFYNGLFEKYGKALGLPDWEEVKPKFMQASFYDKQ